MRTAVSLSLALGVLALSRADEEEPFAARAKALKEASDWSALAALADRRTQEDPSDGVAHGFLAVARCRLGEFEQGMEAARTACDLLGSGSVQIPSLGYLSNEIADALWERCWANYDPELNRRAWSGYVELFPESPWSRTATSRLLMAALKLGDATAAAELDARFGRLAAEARASGRGLDEALRPWVEAYLRAGRSSPEVRDRAAEAWRAAWRRAAERAGAESDEPGICADPEARDRCDLDTDGESNALALACALLGDFDPATNPLMARETESSVRFTDRTDEAGLGDVRGARVAAADFDEDGDTDLCFQGRMMRNDDGVFSDAGAELGLTARGTAALFGDTDNDGDLDLLLPARPHARLLVNQGSKNGHAYADATESSGVSGLQVEAAPEGAAFLDYDADGWLDFYLAVYEGPLAIGHPDLLARNRGDGTFEDASEGSGIRAVAPLCGRGVCATDLDGDGDVDLYVSNYRLQQNRLFVNEGGRFEDRAPALGVEGEEQQGWFGHTIGSVTGDVDGDLDLDLFCANLAHPRFVRQGFSNLSMLYLNPGDGGRFLEARRERGIRFQETHSDPALVDIDNDGDLDLSITCVYEGVPSALYRNDGRGFFDPVTFHARLVHFNAWGQAWFDLEGDGDLDCAMASSSGARLFVNEGNENRYLRVRLVGKRGRPVFGTRVVVETQEDPPRRFVRELCSARGTSSQDEPVLHFGLGTYRGRVSIRVHWAPAGEVQRAGSFVNRTVTIRER